VVERLLLFLFGCLLRLLRFLGHVSLRNPQSWLNASRQSTGIDFRLHQNFKIDIARFEEGKRRRDSRLDEGLARCVNTACLARQRREEVLTWSEEEADGREAER
jgi:hypothetical protein